MEVCESKGQHENTENVIIVKPETEIWNTSVLPQEMYEALCLHDLSNMKTMATIRSWDVCDEPHEDEMELHCASLKPFNALRLSDTNLLHLKFQSNTQGRSVSACLPAKAHAKFVRPNTSHSTIRRSKSYRSVSSAKSSSSILSPQRVISGGSGASSGERMRFRAMCDPAIKQSAKFLLPFNAVQDISYDFRPFLRHQQHVESYRKSYTYILMRRFRELRMGGYAGYKLQAALRLNVGSPTMNKTRKETNTKSPDQRVIAMKPTVTKKIQSPCRKTITPPPVLYYSEACHTGPVLYTRCKEAKTSPVKDNSLNATKSSSLLVGCNKISKSTSSTVPFRQNKEKHSVGEGSQKVVKSTLKTSQSCKHIRSSSSTKKTTSGIGSLVIGKSKTSKPAPKFIRKMSPLGRVPSTSRRASLKDKRSTSVHAVDGSQYLAIAIGSQTVTSPYSHKGTESHVTMM